MTKADAQSTKEQNTNTHDAAPLPASPGISTGQFHRTEDRARLARIRDLNDRLRTTGLGGMVLITNGISALGSEVIPILDAVQEFQDFNLDNDPWGEHDCASLKVNGHQVIWKVDAYDRTREFASPDPADPKVTVRVLTVMLASEY